MDVDRERSWGGGDWRCFNCRVFGHMAKNCQNRRDIREETQEELKENGDQ